MTDSPLILRIAVPTPLRRVFDYLAPADTDPSTLAPGMRDAGTGAILMQRLQFAMKKGAETEEPSRVSQLTH